MKQVVVEVGGKKYRIMQCTAFDQFKVLLKITKAGAAPMLHAFTTQDGVMMTGAVAFAGFMESMSEEDLEFISSIMLKNVREDGCADPIDLNDFQGKMLDYVSLLKEAFVANYSDFMQFLPQEPQEVG